MTQTPSSERTMLPEILIEQALACAHLRSDTRTASLDLPVLAAGLSVRVQPVHELTFPLQPPVQDSFDVLFAPLARLQKAPDPAAVVLALVGVLRPGGRLLLLAEGQAVPAGALTGWLREAGLVNLLLFDTKKQPVLQPDSPVALAVGARSVAGVHAAVQQGYGERAAGLSGAGSCCAPAADESCCTPDSGLISPLDIGYTQSEIGAVPPEAAEIALGCGNPNAFAALRPGEVVLDIGSGGGLDSLLAARSVGPTGRVIGVDMTPAMLARARRAAEKAGYAWVEYRQGQAEALPVADGSVDVALSNCVINLSPDKGLVFAEIFRTLRPGGRLEISDMVSGSALPAALSANAGEWAGCVAGALPEAEYLALVAQSGFVQVSARRSPAGEAYGGLPVYSLAVSARKPSAG